MVLEERDQNPRARDGGVVERIRPAQRSIRQAHADVRASRLEVTERRARVCLLISTLAVVASGHPRLDFVLPRLSEADLAGARNGDAIRNLELLEDRLRV